MTAAVVTNQASVTTLHESLSNFTNIIMLRIINRDSSIYILFLFLFLKCNFCLCYVFNRRIRQILLRYLQFRYVLCSGSSKTFVQFFTLRVVNNGLREPYLLLTDSSFTWHFFRVMHRAGDISINWVKFVKIPKQKFESQLHVINLSSVL